MSDVKSDLFLNNVPNDLEEGRKRVLNEGSVDLTAAAAMANSSESLQLMETAKRRYNRIVVPDLTEQREKDGCLGSIDSSRATVDARLFDQSLVRSCVVGEEAVEANIAPGQLGCRKGFFSWNSMLGSIKLISGLWLLLLATFFCLHTGLDLNAEGGKKAAGRCREERERAVKTNRLTTSRCFFRRSAIAVIPRNAIHTSIRIYPGQCWLQDDADTRTSDDVLDFPAIEAYSSPSEEFSSHQARASKVSDNTLAIPSHFEDDRSPTSRWLGEFPSVPGLLLDTLPRSMLSAPILNAALFCAVNLRSGNLPSDRIRLPGNLILLMTTLHGAKGDSQIDFGMTIEHSLTSTRTLTTISVDS